MSKRTDELGRRGERTAELFLNSRGLNTIDRNWRSGQTGEIDLVASDGDVIVFVEVKTRSGNLEAVQEVVSRQKLARLRRLAAAWLREKEGYSGYRIDLVGVAANQETQEANISWWRGIDR